MNKQNVFSHCFNCTSKDNSKLPEKYQGVKVTSIRGVDLCPRCKCPELVIEVTDFEPSKGYRESGYNKGK